jgi:hypothetical protein
MRSGTLFNVAQAIGILAGEHLLEHRHGLVQIILRRNGFSYGLAILRFGSEIRGVNDGFEEGQKGVGIGPDVRTLLLNLCLA